MTFTSCKSFTFDYIYYISELFCKMQEHSGTIRFMFYAVTIAEIVKYVQKRKFKAITIAVLLSLIIYDLMFIRRKQKKWKQDCDIKPFIILKDKIDDIQSNLKKYM